MQIKKQLSQLMHLTTTSMENELSTIDKVKTILKKLRETNGQIIERDHHLQLIDSLVVNLSTLQRRLRE
jgi:flagellin-specific chaperone FliS